ncbi:MAG: response regulator [Leptolyngbya sp. PLA3]|nr:MAG: response regulator [Cyanobacteria bacterium CYA]MCE7967764.1 response regulator [Leptolyngbya sp. PL-A3]
MHEGKHVILYVDDDPDYRYAMRQLLEANGMEMVEAADGEEGLCAYRDHKPELILLDLMMEEIDAGVNLLRELRADGNKAPVYLISSVGDTMSMTTNAAELGFAGVFQKPVNPKALLAVLQSRLHH